MKQYVRKEHFYSIPDCGGATKARVQGAKARDTTGKGRETMQKGEIQRGKWGNKAEGKDTKGKGET